MCPACRWHERASQDCFWRNLGGALVFADSEDGSEGGNTSSTFGYHSKDLLPEGFRLLRRTSVNLLFDFNSLCTFTAFDPVFAWFPVVSIEYMSLHHRPVIATTMRDVGNDMGPCTLKCGRST